MDLLIYCYIAGVLTRPLWLTCKWLVRVTYVAVHDAYWLAWRIIQNNKLSDAKRIGALLAIRVVVREFFRSWGETAYNSAQGMERVL